ncbi:MAG TPA: PA2779 family protein [Terracidiphilus sp.]|jgi:hypothetical protein|nr:PA2779 family protein [Terracidiphilus sp.]
MHFQRWQSLQIGVAVVLIAAFAVPKNLAAQASQHLVSPSDMQQAVVSASQTRQQNAATLDNFLSSHQAQQALQSAHMNPEQVKHAVAGLSDDELAQLASRAQNAQADFAAGAIDNHDLLIILVCIAALILIIVAVH